MYDDDQFKYTPDHIDCSTALCDYYAEIIKLMKKQYYFHRLNSIGLGGLYRNMLHHIVATDKTEYGVILNETSQGKIIEELTTVQEEIIYGVIISPNLCFGCKM